MPLSTLYSPHLFKALQCSAIAFRISNTHTIPHKVLEVHVLSTPSVLSHAAFTLTLCSSHCAFFRLPEGAMLLLTSEPLHMQILQKCSPATPSFSAHQFLFHFYLSSQVSPIKITIGLLIQVCLSLKAVAIPTILCFPIKK